MPGTVNTVNTGNDLLTGFFYLEVPVLTGSLSDQLLFSSENVAFLKKCSVGKLYT